MRGVRLWMWFAEKVIVGHAPCRVGKAKNVPLLQKCNIVYGVRL
jgi:hypothetical protein